MTYWLLILGGALSFLGMLFHGVIEGKSIPTQWRQRCKPLFLMLFIVTMDLVCKCSGLSSLASPTLFVKRLEMIFSVVSEHSSSFIHKPISIFWF